MRSESFINEDGIVLVVHHGVQDFEEASAAVEALQSNLDLAPTNLAIIDISDCESFTREARSHFRVSSMAITDPHGDRRAILCFVGGTPFIRAVVKFIITSAARRGLMGFQPTQDAAVAWLLAQKQQPSAA